MLEFLLRVKRKSHLLQSLAEIEVLKEGGKREEAKEACLFFLDDNPQEIKALHLISSIYVDERDWSSAKYYLERAVALAPDDLVLSLQLALVLKSAGEINEARDNLLRLIQINPDFAPAYNNLGTIYFNEQQWQEAINAYQAAIMVRADYLDAYYNLGLAFSNDGRVNDAIETYQALLQLSANHAGASFQLARLYMAQANYKIALQWLLRLENQFPFHFETQINLATCYLHLGLFMEAKAHYLKAVDININDEQVNYNLGVMSMQQGQLADAMTFYLRVLSINPHHFSSHYNIGIVYLTKQDKTNALLHFRKAKQLEPNNENLSHLIAMLTTKQGLPAAPIEYVRSLFNAYADHYDAHLTSALHYNVPNIMADMLTSCLQQQRYDVLDLGCGTGLCGERLRTIARKLVGVDVAENMLSCARQKNIYDELVLSDITTYLSDHMESYDLVIAGDVLVYFGDLQPIYRNVSRLLKSNGYFALTAEVMEEGVYGLSPSGRFVHQQSYLDDLAVKNQFDVRQYYQLPLREQEGSPLMGHVYLLQKMG